MKKILTIVGARPQFIKAAAVSRAIKNSFSGEISEQILHTGQHFDSNMSDVFFQEMAIPKPKYHFQISGGSHGKMTGAMLSAIEEVMLEERPDWVLIYGDTNSTLAGALAASKLHIPVAHVEAGLRSFNMRMPEEINRILSDRVSTLLFCPTQTAIQNLENEGIKDGVINVGDVMFDVALFYKEQAKSESRILEALQLEPEEYVLATCHRAENTDDKDRLTSILMALSSIAETTKLVLPIHPRTRKLIAEYGLDALLHGMIVIDPVSFIDMVALEQSASVIVTDSGGVQKEAFFYGVPCITMRDETEWVETVKLGANQLVGADSHRISDAFRRVEKNGHLAIADQPYGNGFASEKILEKILSCH